METFCELSRSKECSAIDTSLDYKLGFPFDRRNCRNRDHKQGLTRPTSIVPLKPTTIEEIEQNESILWQDQEKSVKKK